MKSPSTRPFVLLKGAMLIASAAWLMSACGPVYVQSADEGYYAQGGDLAPAPGDQWAYLGAYGSWVDNSGWGRVWVPAANRTPGWRPYYDGRWDYTEYGWTWVSEEAWGWGPYHYGRWGWDPTYHWVWIPGYTWGPAWVTWRFGGGCVGWAPLGPSGVVYSQPTYWTFIPQANIYRHRVATVVIRPARSAAIYRQSVRIGRRVRIRNHRGGVTVYNAGPRTDRVTRWTGRPVATTRVSTIPSAVPRRRARTPSYAGRRGTSTSRPAATYRPRATYRRAPTSRPGPSYRPAPRSRPPTYRSPAISGRPTSRPGVPYRRAPTARRVPTYAPRRSAPTYRPAPAARPRSPIRTRPAPYTRPSTRYVPSQPRAYRRAPTYRPAPSRPSPRYGRPTPGPGRAAPRADRRSTPYRVHPRGSSSRRSSSRSSSRRRRSNTRRAPSRPTRPWRRDR